LGLVEQAIEVLDHDAVERKRALELCNIVRHAPLGGNSYVLEGGPDNLLNYHNGFFAFTDRGSRLIFLLRFGRSLGR